MKTWHLHIRGRVQGVGFRPFVWRAARALGLQGEVCNTTDGVHVWFAADESTAGAFAEKLTQHPPPLARVVDWRLETTTRALPEGFHIANSRGDALPDLVVTPDAALCTTCREELHRPGNRRHQYAFTTCTQCGPRYSIIEALPYDRPRTAMAPLPMCGACQAEYDDPADRRYFSQTNSCTACPVPLFLWEQGRRIRQQEADAATLLERVVALWQDGGIVAVKGIGGYLLTCDACDAEAVRRLRKRKHRPDKPLAVMVPALDWVHRLVELPPGANQWMQGPVAPIVVAPVRAAARQMLPIDVLAPGLDELGIMLPYAPLFELLLARFGRPVVATSGNVSGAPLIYEDDTAIEHLGPMCEAILGYERRIVTPQDDSVLRLSANGTPIWLRRGRGLAPSLLLPRPVGHQNILAMGARMKSTFALQVRGRQYVSQYLGDTESFEAWRSYLHVLDHLQRLLAFEPEQVLVDLHPDFPATRLGQAIAERLGLPCTRVPHHEAHF
ncbi:MAG: carbamoyltransferase HypF, partial [Bacteroidetes bacterium]